MRDIGRDGKDGETWGEVHFLLIKGEPVGWVLYLHIHFGNPRSFCRIF